MLLSDEEIQERMESPLNLLNRLRTSLNKATILPSSNHAPVEIPVLPPKSADIIPNLDDKVRDAGTRSKASGILNAAMDELHKRIPEVQKPEKLAQIAAEMAKVINQHDSKPRDDNEQAKIVIYAPQIQTIDRYEVIDVAE